MESQETMTMQLHIRRLGFAGLITGLTLAQSLTAQSLSAQDETAPPDTAAVEPQEEPQEAAAEETPRAKFDRLYGEWQALSAQAQDQKAAFDAAAETDKEAIRSAYNDSVNEMQELLPQLSTAALEAYEAAESPDETLQKILLGMMINDAVYSRDRQALKIAQILTERGCPRELMEQALAAKRLGPFSKEIFEEALRRYDEFQADDLPRVKMVTSKGEIELELYENEAPNTVANFVKLIDSGFYNGLTFHRVLEDFVAQGGDPKGDGTGGPGYSIACECFTSDHRNHFPGVLSMAHSGRDTGGSQFFITLNTYARLQQSLDGRHTVFGRVIGGQEVLDQLTRRNPELEDQPEPDKIIEATVTRRRDHEYQPEVTPDPDSKAPSDSNEGNAGTPPGGEEAGDEEAGGEEAGETTGGEGQ
jgi:cyclophilin family peptidyl-prolyl cis-trans isomerase